MVNIQETLEGLIRTISSMIPENLNPKMWITRSKDTKGSPQNFDSLSDLVAFHPFKMEKGMVGRVYDFPTVGKSTDFKLMYDPSLLYDANEDTIVTLTNYTTFWKEILTVDPVVRVFEYAPDESGAPPTYPYTVGTESNWEPEFDPQKNHRWIRFRDDDIDDNSDGIFDNWSVPISISSYAPEDYIDKKFQRYALSKPDQDLTQISDLENGRHYLVISGTITHNGVDLKAAARFTYTSGDTVVFTSATVNETNIPPSRIDVNGFPNNDPVEWSDTPPAGSDILWMILGQKSAFGQLKSEWIIRKIEEDPSLIRYSYASVPDPNTLCTTTDTAAAGTGVDTALINAGWTKTYSDQNYMAYREDLGGGTYSSWTVEKIAEDTGEYVDKAYKLYPINTDPSTVSAPTERNAINDGWSPYPLVEGPTDINFETTARKFIDGNLKITWSDPIIYSGRTSYHTFVSSDSGDDFKIDPNTVPDTIVPSLITLQFNIYKGTQALWEQSGVSLSFVWTRVYNNGAVDSTEAGPTSSSNFYYLATSGTAGQPGYLFDDQRIAIKPAAVTGKAVFRCVATLSTADQDITFTQEFSIVNVTDGKDFKSITVRADNQLMIYDTTNTVFVPTNIVLRGYYSNLSSPMLYWYYWTGAAWSALTTGSTYTAAASTYFTGDSSAEEQRFAVSNHTTDPTAADGVSYFTDYVTIGKVGSASVGSPGENAVSILLNNEAHVAYIDNTTGQPASGEITASGRAITKVEMYDGATKLSLGTSGTDGIMSIASDNANITFAQQFGTQGTDAQKYAEVYISTWTADEVAAVCTITITYNSKTYTKKFSVTSSEDAPGAIILSVDSNKGYIFTSSDRTDKTFTASLYDSNVLQTSGYEYGWYIDGVLQGTYTTSRTKVLSRATFLAAGFNLRCDVRPISGSVIRSTTVKIVDILAVQPVIAWTDYASTTNSNKIVNGAFPTFPLTVGSATWRLTTDTYWQTNDPVFECIGVEGSSQWTWSYPYKIQGVDGNTGATGNYYFPMYKTNGTTITSTWNVITAYNNGWRRNVPATRPVYMVLGRFNGATQAVEADGYPPDTAVPADNWTSPAKISGDDGSPGAAGLDGFNGWTPVFSIVSDGADREVQRLIDWIGGTGTKPGYIGQYVASTGFTTVIANAANIKGSSGNDGLSVQVFTGASTPTGTIREGDVWLPGA